MAPVHADARQGAAADPHWRGCTP